MVKSFFTTENFGVGPPSKNVLSDLEKRAYSLEMAKNRFFRLEKKFQRDAECAEVYRTSCGFFF